MRITPPTYFQTPNDLVDHWLPHLGEAEVKVLLVIFRKTFGWNKIRDRISLSQLEKLTGLERTHASKATKSLMQKGIISKEVVGKNGTQSTYYELIVVEDSNNLDQCRKDTPTSVVKTPTKETSQKKLLKKQQPKKAANASVVVPSIDEEKEDEDAELAIAQFIRNKIANGEKFNETAIRRKAKQEKWKPNPEKIMPKDLTSKFEDGLYYTGKHNVKLECQMNKRVFGFINSSGHADLLDLKSPTFTKDFEELIKKLGIKS